MDQSVSLLNPTTVAKLRELVDQHKKDIDLPKAGRWKTMTNTQLWVSIVGQVGVVGASKPADRMTQALRSLPTWYESLAEMPMAHLREHLHNTLRTYGIRYSSSNAIECRKTGALVKNFALMQSHGGAKGYVERLAQIGDERARIQVVIGEMAFIKEKGARDWLIGIGLLEDALALDVRLMTSLSYLGVDLPTKATPDRALYQRLEQELIEKVCRPSGVTGAVLDRVLYQKYDQIVPRPTRRRNRQG